MKRPNIYLAKHSETGETHYIYAHFNPDTGEYCRPQPHKRPLDETVENEGPFSKHRIYDSLHSVRSAARLYSGYTWQANALKGFGDGYEEAEPLKSQYYKNVQTA